MTEEKNRMQESLQEDAPGDSEMLPDDAWEYESYEQDEPSSRKTERERRREEGSPLFETDTVYSYEEYLRYYTMLENRISHVWLKRGGMVALVIIFVLVMKLRGYGDARTISILVGLAVVLPLLLEYVQRRVLRKKFDEQEQEPVAHICMYEDHFSQQSSMGDTRFQYNDIYRIIETETNFYVMKDRYQGLIIVKKNCSSEMLDAIMDIWRQMEGKDAGSGKDDPSGAEKSGAGRSDS